MATGARLAAYLSGDLDPEEQTAVEAELARDPALRDRLEQIRAADRALADLPTPQLSDDGRDRIQRAVGQELDTVLGDELAARRARRGLPRWVPAAAAAAALVVVVGGGIALTGTMSQSDDAGSVADEAAPEAALDGAGDAGEAADTEASGGAAPAGPRVVALDRTLDEATLTDLAADPGVLDALADTDVTDPTAAASDYARALGADAAAYFEDTGDELDTTEAAEPDARGDRAATGTRAEPLATVSRGDVTAADRAAVAECLPILQEDASSPVVPLYAELGADGDGRAVIAFAALAPDEDGAYRRIEVWLVDRDTCSLRTFVQHDR